MLNPRLIYLNVSAFTSQGPRANEIGFDGIGQVMSGATYMSGFDAQPTRSFCSLVDVYDRYLRGLRHRLRAALTAHQSGKGHYLETSLMTSGYAAMSWLLVEQAATGRNRTRSGNRAQSSGPSDIFRTRDGWIVVQVVGDGLFAKVARLVGHLNGSTIRASVPTMTAPSMVPSSARAWRRGARRLLPRRHCSGCGRHGFPGLT